MSDTVVVGFDGAVLAMAMGDPPPSHESAGPSLDLRYRLSRFALARADGDDMVLETALGSTRVVLNDWRAIAVVHALRRPCRIDDLRRELPMVHPDSARRLVRLLVDSSMAVELPAGISSEDELHHPQALWEFHDLLFHTRVRGGRHRRPVGGTFRFLGRVPPPPAVRPSGTPSAATAAATGAGGGVPLARPDLDRLERDDPPLSAVQEARRSIRQYSDTPVSSAQLGEFLYRVGRIADYWQASVVTPHGSAALDFAARPYPSAGALYELELYCAVRSCDGIDSGFYRYEPQTHSLHLISEPGDDLSRLLLNAGQSAGIDPGLLQVVVVIAARMPRIAWKYETIAYSLVLKDVGVLYANMYLAATAMGLAPCSLGYGDSELFCRLAGTDYYEETSVGEFLLGSAPAV